MRYPDYFKKRFYWKTLALLPLSVIYYLLVETRRLMYRVKLLKSHSFDVPVIVVGNLVVGGAGKTPLVIFLAQYFKAQGWRPGIVSRGYRAQAKEFPLAVTSTSDVSIVGDEAVLLARRAQCPLVIDPNRVSAVNCLLDQFDCNLVISDDGLQHLAMQRDVNIVVEDSERFHGNGFLLPAGPLRESTRGLTKADIVVFNGKPVALDKGVIASSYSIGSLDLVKIPGSEGAPMTVSLASFSGKSVHALAGIGNPDRFFNLLIEHGLQIKKHDFDDHHQYTQKDLEFYPEWPIVMTEKDAVKCEQFNIKDGWYVRMDVQPDQTFIDNLAALIKR